MTNMTSINRTNGHRTNAYLLAFVKYNNLWDNSTINQTPSYHFAKGRGTLYYKQGFGNQDLQWAIDWRHGLNPYTKKFTYKWDIKNKGAFIINYGGTAFVTPPNSRLQGTSPASTSNLSGISIDNNGQSMLEHLSSNSATKGTVYSPNIALSNINLEPAYSTLIQETNNGIGGYETHTPSYTPPGINPIANGQWNPVRYHDKLFLFINQEGNIPSYFISYDRIKKDDISRTYRLQFYTQSTGVTLPADADVLNNTYKVTGSTSEMTIHNLAANSTLRISSETASSNSEVMFPLKRIRISPLNSVTEAKFPLLFVVKSATMQNPSISDKYEDTNLISGVLTWSNRRDTYMLTNDQFFERPTFKGRIKLAVFRENTTDNSITRYAVSEGTGVRFKDKIISFEIPQSTISYDGNRVDIAGDRNNVGDFQLFAPNAQTVSFNQKNISFKRIGNYIFNNSGEVWDFTGLHYGTTGTHTIDADMNSDGYIDILTFTEWGTLLIDYGPLFGSWDYNKTYSLNSQVKFCVAKIDTDVIPDIVVMTSSTLYIDYSSNGFSGWDYVGTGNTNTASGDYNSDGRADIIRYAYPYVMVDYSNDGINNNIQYVNYSQSMLYSATPLIGDFNGDNRNDIALLSGSNVYIDYSYNGFVGFEKIINIGISLPVNLISLFDYDKDNKMDISYANGGTWYIRTSSSNYSTPISWLNYNFSINDELIPADYDKNGTVNPAVKDNKTGKIKILYNNPNAFSTNHISEALSKIKKVEINEIRDEQISVFPNPVSTRGTIKITPQTSGLIELNVYNLLGTLVQREAKQSSSNETNYFDIANNLSNGVYFFTVKIGNQNMHSKFVIMK